MDCQYTVQEVMVSPTHVSCHQNWAIATLAVLWKVLIWYFLCLLCLHPVWNPKFKTTLLSYGKDFRAEGKSSPFRCEKEALPVTELQFWSNFWLERLPPLMILSYRRLQKSGQGLSGLLSAALVSGLPIKMCWWIPEIETFVFSTFGHKPKDILLLVKWKENLWSSHLYCDTPK